MYHLRISKNAKNRKFYIPILKDESARGGDRLGFPSTVSLQINADSTPVSTGIYLLYVLVRKVRSFPKQSEIFMVQAKIKEDQFHKKFCLNDS